MKDFLTAIFLLFLTVSISSCKKESNYPTAIPGAYYPCFPGSWWKYLEKDSVITEDIVSESYILHSYWTSVPKNEKSEPTYVPFVNSKPIYGYRFLRDHHDIATGHLSYQFLYPFFSEKKNFSFYPDRSYYSTHNGNMYEHVMVKAKYFNGVDSVIYLRSDWESGPFQSFKRNQYYTKNVGLTLELLIDTVKNDTSFQRTLIDYHIEN